MSSSNFDQHQLDNDFRQACSLGNLDEVIRNISNKIVDINVQDKYEQFTGLHMACEHGQYSTIEYLLKNNANVNCQNSLGETPLILAVKVDVKSKSKRSATEIDAQQRNQIVELLISYGADLQLGHSTDVDSKAKPKAIHCAVILGDINVIRKLLTKTPQLLSSTDEFGRLPMHYAAKYNKVFAMQELLAAGAEIEPLDNDGYTPFHVACDHGNLDAVQFILDQGGHMHTKTKKGDQGLHIACRHRVKEIVPIVEFLISQGADQQAKDSQGKCLKDYMKDNIVLRNVIANAKKKASKYANTGKWSQYGSNAQQGMNSSGSLFSASFNNDSFGILDLKGQKLITCSGYKIDWQHKGKKVDGTVSLYEHGLLFSFKKGVFSKTTVEEFHPWKPYVDLVADADNNKLLRVEFPHSGSKEEEEKKSYNHNESEMEKFGIVPCRPNELTEMIQAELNKMYPTYALQSEVKKFIERIGDEQGVRALVDEFSELSQNVTNAMNESNNIKVQLNDNSNESDLQGKYDQLMSEINTMQVRLSDIENNSKVIWDECEAIANQKVEPLINDLCEKIDAMVINNEHWKLISNVRKSLAFAKSYKKKLIGIRTQLRPIVIKTNEVDQTNINYSTV